MSVNLIELSDSNIRISDASGVVLESPGYANISQQTPLFGHAARNLNRLHPRHSFNQFWSQLSLDPLVNSNDYFRHQADLAYGHLSSMIDECSITGDVVFTVPGNYTRNQLAILLGVAGQCPFNTVGLVDLGLLYLSSTDHAEDSLFIDIQLHQTVLTTFSKDNGVVKRTRVVQVPGTGLETLYELWLAMITGEFIRQSRFDPQHNADTEQYVYNSLREWIARVSSGEDTLLEINNKGTVHQAKLHQAFFEQRAKPVYKKIQSEIEGLYRPGMLVCMSAGNAELPGLKNYLPEPVVLPDDSYLQQAFLNLEQIKREPDALGLVSTLKTSDRGTPGPSTNTVAAQDKPSHVLIDHHAYPIPDDILLIGSPAYREAEQHFISMATDNVPPLRLNCSGEQPVIENPQESKASLNGQALDKATRVSLGDTLQLGDTKYKISFIRVN